MEVTSSAPNTLRVLVVEDHSDSATAIARLLRLFGHQASIACDLTTAFTVTQSEPFDLLICDIRLPDGSGLDLMRHLRRTSPIKAIAVSGLASAVEIQASREAGFSDHLAKPLDFNKLRETIDRVCRQDGQACATDADHDMA